MTNLESLEALRRAGTQGDWQVDYDYGEGGPPPGIYVQLCYTDFAIVLKAAKQSMSSADAELIVSAVNNLQPLIDKVKELEDQLKRERVISDIAMGKHG